MQHPYMPVKNAPFTLRRFDSGTTLNVNKDGGAFGPASAAPAETPVASGIYVNILTAAEMGGDVIGYKGTAGDERSDGMIYTEPAIDSGVAQGGNSSSITLRAAAPSVDLTGNIVEIVRGTGADSRPRTITGYNTTSKAADVRPNWATAPDATSVYIIRPCPKVDTVMIDTSLFPAQVLAEFWNKSYKVGLVNGVATTAAIPTNLTGLGVNQVLRSVLQCLGTNNEGIMRVITAYDSSTGAIGVDPPFAVAPANGDRVAVFGTTG